MKVLLLSFLLLCLARISAFAGERAEGLHVVGMYGELFSGTKRADLLASMDMWAESVLDEFGERLSVEVVVADDQHQFKAHLDAGRLDFVVVPSALYLALESYFPTEKRLFYEQYGGVLTEYVLLAKKHVGEGRPLERFRGCRLYLAEDTWRTMGRNWLEVQLAEATYGRADDFFDEVVRGPKCSTGVLGVFFGKYDICLVTKGGFEMMVELNPQIGVQLNVVDISPGFIEAVLAPVRRNPALFDAIDRMEDHPQGKQVLTLFGLDKIKSGTVKDFEETRRWIEGYQSLSEQDSGAERSAAEG